MANLFVVAFDTKYLFILIGLFDSLALWSWSHRGNIMLLVWTVARIEPSELVTHTGVFVVHWIAFCIPLSI